MRERKEVVMEAAQPVLVPSIPEPMDMDPPKPVTSPQTSDNSKSVSSVNSDKNGDKEKEIIKNEKSTEDEKIEAGGDKKAEGELSDDVHCYCGRGRNIGAVEFQCALCLKFYHAECVSVYLGKCVPFMTNYQFFCKRCNHSTDDNGSEVFNKKQASFSQMCHTAVAHLMHMSGTPGKFFSKDKDIIPYITENWEALTTMPRRTKSAWHASIAKIMIKDSDIFKCEEDETDPHFCLVNNDLSKIGPNYEAFFKATSGVIKSSDYRLGVTGGSEAKSRANKRRADTVGIATTKQKRGAAQSSVERLNDVLSHAKLVPHGYPSEHPFNKDGYRYILAEPDPHAPNRQAFDESTEWAGKPIPGYLYRKWLSKKVLLALHDRAPQLKISEDRLTVTGDKGYSMVRATHGVNRGSWYYEVTVTEMPQDTATRIGWSQALGNLQAPCGYDKFSYSWRSRKGTRFHESRGRHYSDGYSAGDVLGFFIHIPEPDSVADIIPASVKDKPLVKFKSHLYFEEKDMVQDTIKNFKPVKGSKIIMYKNGVNQGVAWENIPKGTYYPCFSLYKNTTVTTNFGPDFKFPPKDQKDYRPMLDSAFETVITNTLSDILYIVENEGQLPEFI